MTYDAILYAYSQILADLAVLTCRFCPEVAQHLQELDNISVCHSQLRPEYPRVRCLDGKPQAW